MSKANGSAGNGAASANGSGSALELPLLDLPSSHPCHDCGQCCHYIATEIDDPSSFGDYENLRWYLLHEDIWVYVDWEGDWFLEFKTRCKHLTDQKTCGIYEERPKICSEFSFEECEVTTQERAWKYRFGDFEGLLEWLRKRRPKGYEKYMRKRQQLVRKRQAKQARLAAARSAGEAAVEA